MARRGGPRVARVNRSSPELEAAIAEARSRLAEFDQFLATAKEGDRFAVRARFATEAGDEYLWLDDPIPSPSGYLGLVDQRPMVAKLKVGELVAVKRADVVDWMVRRDGKTTGGFTEKALTAPR